MAGSTRGPVRLPTEAPPGGRSESGMTTQEHTMTALVIAEHDNASIKGATFNTVTAALACGSDVHVLVAGHNAAGAAKAASQIAGVSKVIHADGEQLAHGLAENVAAQVLAIAGNYSHILFPATASGKNVAPRVAAKLDVAQISDITKVDAADTFERPIYAGNAIAIVQSLDKTKVITVRTTGFDPAAATGGNAMVETVTGVGDSGKSKFEGNEIAKSDRPELTAAKIIVSGGRALGSAEKFNEVMTPLADKLGAALGASRAAVDAGYAPNDWQVGQTGKIVAPQLYVAAGISGAIQHLAGMKDIAKMPAFEDAGFDTAQAVLEECAKFNEQVVAPLNVPGDRNPSSWKDGVVTTTPGFKDAYRRYTEGGWQGLQHPADFGGQGLPKTVGAACGEMLNSANLSFALCPLLTDGAIEALLTAGSDELKASYLSRLVSGEWTGTMNLTEPQAGSDLALVRTRAEPQPDGTYKVFGTKIFITYGEHDMAGNIVHMVLARVTGAPEGVKGISLFVVPKFMVNKDGSPGERNDVHCVSIEHKLGIKASPTAVLQFGDHGGAVGYLVGQENRGLEYMFIMMNSARYAVGMQGIAIAERAYQHAVAYAKDRVQSRPVDGSLNASAPIIHHPDVKRMLMTMRAYIEGCRAMASVAAAAYDASHHHPDPEVRKQNQAFYEFMVPLVKGYSTEMSLEVASLGVQVHGGMGFIEETGAAQYYRDSRILTIYEGTTAIQANDLVGRKTARDGGQTARGIAAQIEKTEAALAARDSVAARAVLKRLAAARKAFTEVVD